MVYMPMGIDYKHRLIRQSLHRLLQPAQPRAGVHKHRPLLPFRQIHNIHAEFIQRINVICHKLDHIIVYFPEIQIIHCRSLSLFQPYTGETP